MNRSTISLHANEFAQFTGTLYLPATVTTISYGAFAECLNLAQVQYDGAPTDKKAMTIGDGNAPLTDVSWQYMKEAPVEVEEEEQAPDVVEPYVKPKESWVKTAVYAAILVAAIAFLFVMFVRKPKY